MRKLFIFIVLVFLVLGMAFASGQKETKDAVGEKVTIRVLTRFSGSDSRADLWKEAIEEFQEMYPNVKIEDDSVNQEASYNNKLQTDLATGNLPNLFYSPGIVSNVKLAENGLIMDLTPLMEDKEWFDGFVEGSFEVWNYGKYGVPGYYGLPHALSTEIFIYNKELFAKAGIEKTPETMSEFYEVLDKLNAVNVTPWAVGAKSTWRTGHIHNYLLYKTVGVEAVADLGSRNGKWTDPEIVNSLALLKDLKDRGAFWDNFEGIDYDMEKMMFFNGDAAMILNGSWFIGDVVKTGEVDKYGSFPFPYFEDKPQFKGHTVSFPQGFRLKAGMGEAEKKATIDFAKFYTGKVKQLETVSAIQLISSRKDLDFAGIDLNHLYLAYTDALSNATMLGADSFDYDPLSSMQDRTRNSIVGMLLGNSPEEAAAEIQAEIDQN